MVIFNVVVLLPVFVDVWVIVFLVVFIDVMVVVIIIIIIIVIIILSQKVSIPPRLETGGWHKQNKNPPPPKKFLSPTQFKTN